MYNQGAQLTGSVNIFVSYIVFYFVYINIICR